MELHEDWESHWERVLWKKRPYPDNYVPRSKFLESLRRNTNFEPYTYTPLVVAAWPIAQHISAIFIFLSAFVHLKKHVFDPRVLVWLSVVAYACGYMTWELLSPSHTPGARSRVFKSSMLVFLALVALSPVLKTLTEATSSDTIWAISASLFFLHTILADYTTPSPQEKKERLTSVLSMNAAISSSVVLASRLSSDLAVFSLVLLAVQTFALYPLLRRRLQLAGTSTQSSITLLLAAFAIIITQGHSNIAASILIASLVSIVFLAPALLVWAQRYKNEIRGPWDVAVPQLK